MAKTKNYVIKVAQVNDTHTLVMYVSRPLLRGLGLVTALTVFDLGLVLVSDLLVLSRSRCLRPI